MKTLLTAAALALAIPAGAALADTHCDVPTANMQSWESLIQLTKDFGWSISKMELDDGCGNAVVCDCCGCIGPQDARREEAVALWNGTAVNALRRSAPAPT